MINLSRDNIANQMNAEELTEARALARKCVESNYKNCTP